MTKSRVSLLVFAAAVLVGLTAVQADNGTVLTVALGGPPACEGNTTSLSGTVTSTAARDSAAITTIINGGPETQVGVITPQDFTSSGRIKTAPFSVTLPEGTEGSVTICFVQDGAQGRTPKRTCVDAQVSCAPIPCEACADGTSGSCSWPGGELVRCDPSVGCAGTSFPTCKGGTTTTTTKTTSNQTTSETSSQTTQSTTKVVTTTTEKTITTSVPPI